MADTYRLPLDVFYEREARHPNKRYMVQPLPGGQLLELSWADVGEQARRTFFAIRPTRSKLQDRNHCTQA